MISQDDFIRVLHRSITENLCPTGINIGNLSAHATETSGSRANFWVDLL
jgi:hypothetical protein